MNILETIHQRRSVRSFSPKVMEQPEIEKIQGMLETASSEPGPFGTRIRLKLYIDTSGSGEARMGTYGLISGASAFIMPVVVDAPGAMEDLGWTVERAIIDLWAAGWASCWIGGVFSGQRRRAWLVLQGRNLSLLSWPWAGKRNREVFWIDL